MSRYCPIHEFLSLRDAGVPLLDVRSPREFSEAHIPGASNLPLFSDAEREAVGRAYAQKGSEAAVRLGLELVGPQLADKLEQAYHVCGTRREVLMHCWRGGMRSSSMAGLLEAGGFQVVLLEGGYKAYRAQVRRVLARPASIYVLGGMTGSGKTEILAELARLGHQVVDLEGLARHRGSAFGGIGQGPQPRTEMFENLLAGEWDRLDFSRPVWIEDEDRRIGNVALDPVFFAGLQSGLLFVIELPAAFRVRRLVHLYAEGDHKEELAAAVMRLEKRLGHEACRVCIEAVRAENYTLAVQLILRYYDKAYSRQLDRRGEPAFRLVLTRDDPAETASRLAALQETIVQQQEKSSGGRS